MRISSLQLNALKQKLVWFGVSCVIVVAAFVPCLYALFNGPSEPGYQGLGLQTWLDGSTVSQTSPGRFASAKAMCNVIQSVGPEALPWLVSELEQSGRPGFKDLVFQW